MLPTPKGGKHLADAVGNAVYVMKAPPVQRSAAFF